MLYCTIITKSHMARARVLHRSLLRHNPDAELLVFMADHLPKVVDPKSSEEFTIVTLPEYADDPVVQDMSFYYEVYELCGALRPFIHEYLLTRTQADRWIYLDSDVYVNDSLAVLDRSFVKGSILLTPHSLAPLAPAYGQKEIWFLRWGVFNSGFIGIKRSQTCQDFIRWWKDRLTWYCFAEERGQFVDQMWLNFVPFYYPDHVVCWHRGANFGLWRIFSHRLRQVADGRYLVDEDPLLFCHLSGFRRERENCFCWHRPDTDADTREACLTLERAYRAELELVNGISDANSSYSFSTFASGQPITRAMRMLYYNRLRNGLRFDSSPFDMADYFYSELDASLYSRLKRRVRKNLFGLHGPFERA